MPGAAHMFFGISIGIALFFVSRGKFTPYHVFLYAFTNILGPDLAWPFFQGETALFFHTALGYAFLALPFSALFAGIGLAIGEKIQISKVYAICVAGGFGHMLVDAFGHPGEPYVIWKFGNEAYLVDPARAALAGFLFAAAGVLLAVTIALVMLQKSREKSRPARLLALLRVSVREAAGMASILSSLVLVILLGDAMPHLRGSQLHLSDLWNTGIWGPDRFGDGFSSNWIIMTSLAVAGLLGFVYRYLSNRSRALFLASYAVFLFVALSANYDLGATEADSGVQYFLLAWFVLPGAYLVYSTPGVMSFNDESFVGRVQNNRFFIRNQFIAILLGWSIFAVVSVFVLVLYPYAALPGSILLFSTTGAAITLMVIIETLKITRTNASPHFEPHDELNGQA